MGAILEFCKNEYFMLGIFIINLLIIGIFVINTITLNKTKKSYKTLIKKLGRSNNIDDVLREYIGKLQDIEQDNKQIKTLYENLNKDMGKCLRKVGIVRYSAFKDVGSDLSFALAILDDDNNGVVLNGIYSVENSNIYAKPIQKGKSQYSISEEEQKAIEIAIQK